MPETCWYTRDIKSLQPVAATISAVVEGGAVLLVRRLNPPDAGRWGFPGGKIETGEPIHEAAVRELYEETGLRATAERIFTAVDVIDRDPQEVLHHHFILIAVLCRDPTGVLTPGSDAGDARWFQLDEIENASLATSFQVAEVAREAVALASIKKDGETL
ncbi:MULTISPECIES: NUDIX hydrolase [Gammaproteobacteria]|uniref:NUDIX hydrolase n=1 Tax=Gammaproteobacteria TaxID=1236 RepID=UPI003F974C6E